MSFLSKSNDGVMGEDCGDYFRFIRMKRVFIAVMSVATVLLVLLSFGVGKYDVGLIEAWKIIFNDIYEGVNTIKDDVVWELRVPRGLAGAIAGACLAVSGCVMQSMLRNPLADPYTTGVSSGASLGASIAIIMGISIIPVGGQVSIIANAFIMSLIPAAIITFVSVVKKVSPTTMILIGIGIMYMFSAFTQLLKLNATPDQMEEIYMWQLGSLSMLDISAIPILLVTAIVGIVALYSFKGHLNMMSLGDNPAMTLGTNPWRTRVICLVIISFMTAVIVSFTGTIGFVGLVAPQMVRVFIGSDNRYLLPASACFGAAFLVAADMIARVVGTTGVPVGVITAIVGSPLFLYLLIKKSKKQTV